MGARPIGSLSNTMTKMVSTRESTTATSVMWAPQQIPTAIDQNIKHKSIGSLTAVLKRTIERAPTIPNEITMLDCTAKIIAAVVTARAANEILKSWNKKSFW